MCYTLQQVEFISTDKAPKPIGPYSQAVRVGNFLFLSGQTPIDPTTDEATLFDGDIAKQTERVLKNIEAILKSQKLTKDAVIKTTIFLTDLAHFPKVNEVYAQFFGNHKPARTTVEVSKLPKGVAIEIEAQATFLET